MIPKIFSEIPQGSSQLLQKSKEIIGNKPIDINVLDKPINLKLEQSNPNIKSKLENQLKETTTENPEKTATNVEKMHTRNEELEGQKHPETGVPFEKKIVENGEGQKVEVVVPKFDSIYDVQLPEDLYKATDAEQFAECNKQLKEAIQNDPELKKKFTEEQLEQIMNGDTPDGYTWHHDAETGKMQLVDAKTHAQTGHTGGKVIWGGGSENR